MQIKRIESRLMVSNMYVITERGHSIVIDPCDYGVYDDSYLVDKIILTHEHYDHISGVNVWKEKTSAPVLCSNSCSKNLGNTKMNLARHFREFCELQTWMKIDVLPEIDLEYSCYADEVFFDNIEFDWQDHRVYLFEIPGHSQGSIGILIDDTFFFSGDSLIPGKEIELRLPGGSRKMWENIGKHRIEELKRGTQVFPGHLLPFVLE